VLYVAKALRCFRGVSKLMLILFLAQYDAEENVVYEYRCGVPYCLTHAFKLAVLLLQKHTLNPRQLPLRALQHAVPRRALCVRQFSLRTHTRLHTRGLFPFAHALYEAQFSLAV
jgi:hypothetical protein